MNATNCIGGQNKIRYLYSVFVILYAVRGVKGLIKNFELWIDSMECARPAVVEGEGLGEGLADDVACLVVYIMFTRARTRQFIHRNQ